MDKYLWAPPTFAIIAMAVGIAAVFTFLFSWGLDKAFLRRLLRDRITCIAYGCVLAFLLLMGGMAWRLTVTDGFRNGPVQIPPLHFALAFLLGVGLAGALRMTLYSHYEGNLEEAVLFDADYSNPALYDAEVLAWDEEQGHKNYLHRHWVGHLSLPVSYWVNGVLLPLLIVGLVELIAEQVKAKSASLQALSAIALAYLVISIIVWIWSSVGIWRSAYWHPRRGGSVGWGLTARLLILVGACGALYRSGDFALQAEELGHLAAGRDSLGAVAAMTVSKDGRELTIKGALAEGAADRFQAVLDASPKVRELELSSPGGRMFEAEKMADAIHKRGLDTRVVDTCMSACTTLLLAGRERTAPQTAQIGFHQPTFPGLDGAELAGMIRHARDDYLAAGVDPGFVWRAMETPASSIWVPTPDQLVAAHVLTDSEIVVGSARRGALAKRVDPAVHAQLEAAVARFNATGPIHADAFTTVDRMEVQGTTLTRYYAVRFPRGYILSRPKIAVALRRNACSNPDTARMIGDGVTLVESIRDGTGKPMFTTRITDCSGF